jgi:hypothetical protein
MSAEGRRALYAITESGRDEFRTGDPATAKETAT